MVLTSIVKGCYADDADQVAKWEDASRLMKGAHIGEAVLAVTAVVLGVLALLNILPLPASAAYIMIGAGGAVAVTKLLSFIHPIVGKATKEEFFSCEKKKSGNAQDNLI